LIGAAAAAIAAAGCGSGSERPSPPPPPVRLTITAPPDSKLVRGANVEVRGTVVPATAQVSALGRPALVTNGSFSVVVPLDPGANVLDIAATAAGRRPALTAIRVTREERVTVPDLTGVVADDLEGRLTALGLRLEAVRGGSLFDALAPGEPKACEQAPSPGSRVRRGTTVRVTVARLC
jgi:hypothetical protein